METNHNFLQTGGQPVSDRMRELLARAAHDHVYEQRSHGEALDDLRQRLEGGLSGVTEHIASIGERVKPVAELPALWADVGVMAENVDEGLTRLQTMIESAERIVAATDHAAQRMEEMSKRLDRLQGTMEASSVRFNRLDKSLAELGHRAERLDHSINAVSTRVDHALGEMADRVEQGLEAVNGRVEGVGGRLDGLDGRMEGLSGKLTVEVSDLRTKLSDLADRPAFDQGHRFDALEKHLADAVDPLIEEVRARPDRGETAATLTKQAETLQTQVAEQLSTVHTQMLKRLATLEETILALAEAVLRPRRETKN